MPRVALRIVPGGINQVTDLVTGNVVEGHSSTCSHCQHITDYPSRKVMMDYVDLCFGCMKLVCRQPACVENYKRFGCVPYEKQAEAQELEQKLKSLVHVQAWRCY